MTTLIVLRVLMIVIGLTILIAFGVKPGTFRRAPVFSRNRRKNPLQNQTVLATFDFATPNITVTTNTPVSLSGIPQLLTDTGKLPVSATRPTLFTVVLVYDTPGSVTSVTVPQNDPAIRSSTGGYLSPGSFPAT